ncbi:MAG TPA: NAD(P)H-binding protein [Chthoniobacterales bacterium]|nr:NAD(P)H-binding protein [Chthoniobacterales bacterium]
MPNAIFITGGTGYIGSRLIPLLTKRGHQIKALVRDGSQNKLPTGAIGLVGDALKADSYTKEVHGSDTFVHLIGVPHPSPAKAKQFREIDLVSIAVAIKAARDAEVRHFVYLSVAHPAPMMKDFIAVRSAGEQMIRESGIPATFVRPWYVLGPGHRWPYAIVPVYWVLELIPKTKESAERLGLVTIKQMLSALVWAIENPPIGVEIIDVPRIRELSRTLPLCRKE